MADKELTPAQLIRARLGRREQRQSAGEAQAVLSLLTLLKIPPDAKRQLYELAKTSDRESPNLSDFREVLSDCPVFFAYKEHKELRSNASLGELFPVSKYKNKWFVKTFLEAREDLISYCDGKIIALLLTWPYMTHPMVMHTAANSDSPGVRIVLKLEDATIPRITLEPLEQFVDTIKKHW